MQHGKAGNREDGRGREQSRDREQSRGALTFSCEQIELSPEPGAAVEGSFHIYMEEGPGGSGRALEAYVTATDGRMECLTPYAAGSGEEICYCFHGEYMEPGETLRGEFRIVSSLGEYRLPFMVLVEEGGLDSSIGRLTGLTHFTNLAKSNWQEAVALFYGEGFEGILEAELRPLYHAMSRIRGNEHNMEEFLLSAGRKQRIEYTTEEAAISLDNPREIGEGVLTVVKNGWGHTFLRVETEGDFVFTERKYLEEGDFPGNICRLPVYIEREQLHRGRNFGRIHLVNDHTRLTIPVVVRLGAVIGPREAVRREKKKLHARMVRLYLNYRMKKLSRAEWQGQTDLLMERLQELDGTDISTRLFQAQILISKERYNEAEWLLGRAGELLQDSAEKEPELWAYYKYLTTLLRPEAAYMEESARLVEQIYKANRSSWRVAWLLLFLSEEYERSTSGKWLFLENQWNYGCRSPVMYLEALLLLLGNPVLLRKLEGFELQVLWFGARNDMLSPELAEQLLLHAGRMREFSEILYRILIRLWKRREDDGYLQEICSLLIKGGRTGTGYFPWYRLGVERELRITRLYEFYMLSVDMEQGVMLPRQVLMYFSYQDNLDYERTALLYSCVAQCRDEYPELYGVYKNRIGLFMLRQIQKEHINRDLAYLYRELLTSSMVGDHNGAALCRLFFAYEVWWEEDGIESVIVCQPGNHGEMRWPAVGKKRWVPLYGEDNLILLEDKEGNRLAGSARIGREKLMNPGRLLNKAVSFVRDNPALDIYMCGSGREWSHVSASGMERVERVCAGSSTESWLKRELTLRLARYLCENGEGERFEALLARTDGGLFSAGERAELFGLMVQTGSVESALAWLEDYGPYGLDTRLLALLASKQIEEMEYREDAALLEAAEYAFERGRREGIVLRYLCLYRQGLTEELCELWKAAGQYGVDRSGLTERILEQILFSGAFPGETDEILEEYAREGGDILLADELVRRSVAEYLAGGDRPGEFAIRRLHERLTETETPVREELSGEELSREERLAFLRYLSEKGCPQEMEEAARAVLEDFLKEGIRLNFFRRLSFCQDLLWELGEQTIVEYRGRGGSVRIRYALLREDWQSDWMTEEMSMVYTGCYVKVFTLFFGEKLRYIIEEEAYGELYETPQREVGKNDMGGEGVGGAYGLVNRMIISGALGDQSRQARLLETYEKNRFFNERLFETR